MAIAKAKASGSPRWGSRAPATSGASPTMLRWRRGRVRRHALGQRRARGSNVAPWGGSGRRLGTNPHPSNSGSGRTGHGAGLRHKRGREGKMRVKKNRSNRRPSAGSSTRRVDRPQTPRSSTAIRGLAPDGGRAQGLRAIARRGDPGRDSLGTGPAGPPPGVLRQRHPHDLPRRGSGSCPWRISTRRSRDSSAGQVSKSSRRAPRRS